MDKIIIYTNETCPYCKIIKERLENKKIDFEERSTKDWIKDWQEIIDLTGMPSVPTIEYKEQYFVAGRDFPNAEVLINIIKNFNKSKSDNSLKVYERLKTLNYNINIAFTRVDKILQKIETKINKDEHKSTD